jgi:hypothetical protein
MSSAFRGTKELIADVSFIADMLGTIDGLLQKAKALLTTLESSRSLHAQNLPRGIPS